MLVPHTTHHMQPDFKICACALVASQVQRERAAMESALFALGFYALQTLGYACAFAHECEHGAIILDAFRWANAHYFETMGTEVLPPPITACPPMRCGGPACSAFYTERLAKFITLFYSYNRPLSALRMRHLKLYAQIAACCPSVADAKWRCMLFNFPAAVFRGLNHKYLNNTKTVRAGPSSKNLLQLVVNTHPTMSDMEQLYATFLERRQAHTPALTPVPTPQIEVVDVDMFNFLNTVNL